jgi:hypothetical protein
VQYFQEFIIVVPYISWLLLVHSFFDFRSSWDLRFVASTCHESKVRARRGVSSKLRRLRSPRRDRGITDEGFMTVWERCQLDNMIPADLPCFSHDQALCLDTRNVVLNGSWEQWL